MLIQIHSWNIQPENIQLILIENIKEKHLWTKKLDLNRNRNSKRYIEFWAKNWIYNRLRDPCMEMENVFENAFIFCYSFRC